MKRKIRVTIGVFNRSEDLENLGTVSDRENVRQALLSALARIEQVQIKSFMTHDGKTHMVEGVLVEEI